MALLVVLVMVVLVAGDALMSPDVDDGENPARARSRESGLFATATLRDDDCGEGGDAGTREPVELRRLNLREEISAKAGFDSPWTLRGETIWGSGGGEKHTEWRAGSRRGNSDDARRRTAESVCRRGRPHGLSLSVFLVVLSSGTEGTVSRRILAAGASTGASKKKYYLSDYRFSLPLSRAHKINPDGEDGGTRQPATLSSAILVSSRIHRHWESESQSGTR